MIIKYIKFSAWVTLLALVVQNSNAAELDGKMIGAVAEKLVPELVVKPSSCVALHRNQFCYQTIQLHWTSDGKQQYCLFNDSSNVLLYCSSQVSSIYIHKYASKSSEAYTLRVGETGVVVSQVSVSTSWVYRTGRRSSSGWRLF